MKRRLLLLSAALAVVILVAVVYGQSPAAAAYQVPNTKDMSWSEIAALLAVVTGSSSVFQWILTRAIVQPQIERSIKASTAEIMKTCIDMFATKYQFGLHENESRLEHESINDSIQEIVKHQDVENARLTDVRERVRVIEAHRRT